MAEENDHLIDAAVSLDGKLRPKKLPRSMMDAKVDQDLPDNAMEPTGKRKTNQGRFGRSRNPR
ncbi:hypothetical protein [Rhizobium rhizogenes]|uniref:hypothetical protein n=1 Tax=Rhizobium rhizogenes TaxID=359 RepID=UPI0015743188|nr:hypothetical protein [Rhizobium rhizogenes]NTG45396.1 hypothetical protein [Rhizobium rhizogenes]